jgi:hypothetical protein
MTSAPNDLHILILGACEYVMIIAERTKRRKVTDLKNREVSMGDCGAHLIIWTLKSRESSLAGREQMQQKGSQRDSKHERDFRSVPLSSEMQ